ncbi:hypothetical protein AGDE_02469 [Angomonas deanei]|nr:hypothetical protein AGDE_02469 [Angomonas deanei]|eukprot:EPY41455.1 hypothetical protein AGDE_02469 [Angomonas deanei]
MVFSIPSYLCTGDRPQKQHVDPRVKGATFYVSRPKTGHNPDALFDKHFLYMWNGERGADLETMRRKEQLESKKKFITPTGFLPTGPLAQAVRVRLLLWDLSAETAHLRPTEPRETRAADRQEGAGPPRDLHRAHSQDPRGTLWGVHCEYL